MRRFVFIFVFLCMSAIVAAKGTKEEAYSQKEAIIGTTSQIEKANRSEYNYDVLSSAFTSLAPIYLDENGSYQPLLCNFATNDSKSWYLTIRDGFTWHDGHPVTSDDFLFSLYYMDEQEGSNGYAARYKEINIIDDKTIEVVLDKANPRELANLTSFRILPKHIYEGISDYTTVENELANIGNGPYRYSSFDRNSRTIEFIRNDDYPLEKGIFDKITIQLFSSSEAMYMALMNGDIDIIWKYSGGIDNTMVDVLSNSDRVSLLPTPNSANSATLIFNNSTYPFDDINIRKAISYALDYDAFVNTFGSSFALASNRGFIPIGAFGYTETEKNKRDLALAKSFLEKAGVVYVDDVAILKGRPLSFSILVRSDRNIHSRYAEMIRNNLKDIGIDVDIEVREVSLFREITEKDRSYQAIVTGLTPFGMNRNQGLGSLYIYGENQMGYGQVFSDDYVAILNSLDSSRTMEEYSNGAKEMQQWYSDNVPAIALFWDSHIQAYNKLLSDFSIDLNFGIINPISWSTVKVGK